MLILGGNQLAAGGYEVANSCRFDRDSSDNLTRTPGSAGNRQTWTWSSWIKRASNLTVEQNILHSYDGSADNRAAIKFQSDGTIGFDTGGSGSLGRIDTSAVYRDVSAWYHIVAVMDTTNATATDRQRIYVNGVRATTTVSAQVGLSFSGGLINTTNAQEIGVAAGGGHIDGYMSEIVFIDGSALDPTSFGEFDADSGVWKPIEITGLTFGTNGFYLPFQQANFLGTDESGNSNDFTVNNLTSIDQTTDTPTNNFATLNAILPLFSSDFSQGNCKWTPTTASQYYWTNSTFGLSQGKWYMEAKLTTAADHNYIGIASDQPEDSTTYLAGGGGTGDANDAYQWGWKSSNGQIFNNASGSAYGATYTTGDILGLYLDLDNNKLYFAKNGTVQNSGTGISITDPGSVPTGVYFPCVADGTASNSSTWEVNFGNPTFTISTGNTDVNGYGNFEYNPSSGTFDGSSKDFLAINSKNLAEYG